MQPTISREHLAGRSLQTEQVVSGKRFVVVMVEKRKV